VAYTIYAPLLCSDAPTTLARSLRCFGEPGAGGKRSRIDSGNFCTCPSFPAGVQSPSVLPSFAGDGSRGVTGAHAA
jgi:hypothetical protein